MHNILLQASIVWDPETSIMNASFSSEVRILNQVGEPSGFYVMLFKLHK
jgi:hypothetical protein